MLDAIMRQRRKPLEDLSGVTVVLQWRHIDVAVELQWCKSCVAVVSEWWYSGVRVLVLS
jgi:hypothetical protein